MSREAGQLVADRQKSGRNGSRATIELKAAARPLNAPMKMHH